MPQKPYHSYGNVAYSPEKIDSPRKTRQPHHPGQVRPERRSTERPLTRKRVQLREAGTISIDAIVGFLCAGVLSGLLMSGYAELTASSDQVVQLRRELQQLEADKKILSAQYEKYFDIQRIEEILGDEMIRPTSDQVVYIDLSQPDAFTIFGNEDSKNNSFWAAFKKIFPVG